MVVKKYFLLIAVLLVFLAGCAGVAQSVDKKLIKGTIGKQYTDVTGEAGPLFSLGYGGLLASEKLSDESILYIHVYDYESSRSSYFGIFGSVQHSYRINGFKVKDGLVTDWVYGLHSPDTEYTHLYGLVFSYDASSVLSMIKDNYKNLVKTSTGENVSSWMVAESAMQW